MKIIADIKITKWMERQILKSITRNGNSVFDIRHNGIALVMGEQNLGNSAQTETVEALRVPKKETYFVRILNKGDKKTYSIDENGIVQLNSKTPKQYLWSDFWLIKYNHQHFFMRKNDGESYFVLPRKALATEDNDELMAFLEKEFRDGLRRKLEKL